MIFLPIVGRELRVASRRPGTYSLRTGVAFGAILLGVCLFLAGTLSVPVSLGKHLFWTLAGLAMLYCLLAGRFATADSLSEEKREGTLGLLFLTDLTGYDVVLGKLAATSITGFYCLLAVMPVMALPLLVGGVTSAEFWRVFLVLVNTCLFSLAIGIFGSTICRDRRSAMAVNLLLLLTFVAGLPSLGGALYYFAPAHPLNWAFLFTCPIYSFALCNDAFYLLRGDEFWITVALVHGLTWLLILLACQIAPRSWQDRPARARSTKGRWLEFWEACSYGDRARRPAHRRRLLDVNAFHWLASRARLKAHHVWVFLGFMALWWLVVSWINGDVSAQEPVAFTTALILNSTLKIWIAIESGQRLAEDRKIGALELLLCTNLRVADLIHGQWLALRRQFLRPLLVVTALELVFMLFLWNQFHAAQTLEVWLTGIFMLLADALALGWVGMSAALIARSHNNATLVTMLRVLILPWLACALAALAAWLGAALFSGTDWTPDWPFVLTSWAGFGLAADLLFGLQARRNLQNNLRPLALSHYAPPPSFFTRWFARSAISAASSLPSSRKLQPALPPAVVRRRKMKFSVLAVTVVILLTGIGLRVWDKLHPKPPPPVIVALPQNPALLRVYPAQLGVFMILPDGSLWRWGQPEGPQATRAPVPEPIGNDRDWLTISSVFTHAVGVRSNGTLWEWRGSATLPGMAPVQVNADRDWAGVSAGADYALARKRDGTLWAWGNNQNNQLGNGAGTRLTGNPGSPVRISTPVPNPVQVGTNQDWLDTSAYFADSLGLRADGTLWVWGQVPVYSLGRSGTNYARPTQVGTRTNWVGLTHDIGLALLACNQAGELWNPLFNSSAPGQPVAFTGQLIVTNIWSDRPAFGVRWEPTPARVRFEIRPDRTLWSTPYLYPAGTIPAAYFENWQIIGLRTNWISVWGASGTTLGLTADGTLWMWGRDVGREPVIDFQARLDQVRGRLANLFGSSSRSSGPGPGPSQPMQKDPRPLLRLISPNPTNAPAK